MPKVVESKIRVRYQETDQMGVVYHANYLVWFEIGRTDWIREIGLSYSQLEQMGVLLPVLDVQCKYKQAAKYDDQVIIQTSLAEMKGVRITFQYEVKRQADGQLLAEGLSQHVFASPELRPLNLKTKMPELHQLLLENME
ncbi:thioesterase family protein [Ammoniphilus sp. YIM 78166]|uniref:acyl-CoA thioesterase n=1 Tax=Ammoniphilus sp. YIM 78166 TaxID=1644106 RepID=UPI00106F43D7|nr:thioesterase family protein [Ammoniphilus sp. YIM 78166]